MNEQIINEVPRCSTICKCYTTDATVCIIADVRHLLLLKKSVYRTI